MDGIHGLISESGPHCGHTLEDKCPNQPQESNSLASVHFWVNCEYGSFSCTTFLGRNSQVGVFYSSFIASGMMRVCISLSS